MPPPPAATSTVRATSRGAKRRIVVLCGVVLAVAAGLLLKRALQPPREQLTGSLRLEPLGGGAFVYRGLVSNSGVVVLRTGVLVVDAQVSERAARQLRERIRAVTALPVKWLVDTHEHLDHCGGNALFAAEGAVIYASDDTLRLLEQRGDEPAGYARAFALPLEKPPPPCAKPSKTFSGKLELSLDGERVQLLQLGATETPDGSAVWLPDRRIFFAGDGVPASEYPFLGVPTTSDGLRDDGAWSGFLVAAGELKPAVLVPGHGDALSGEVEAARRLQELYDLFAILLAATQRELSRGTSAAGLRERAGEHVAGFARRDGFAQTWAGQEQAVARALNALSRREGGYWSDFGSRALSRPAADALAREERALGGDAARTIARALALGADGHLLAVALLDDLLSRTELPAPLRAQALGTRAALCVLALREERPLQPATIWLAAAQVSARAALALDPAQAEAGFALGAAELVSALAFGQSTAAAELRLRVALSHGLSGEPERAAHFLLGKAAWAGDRGPTADAELRAALPPILRRAFPLLRERLERYP